jgi:hypothetical protein
MKIEEVAYAVAGETLVVLEQRYHYRIPDEHKRDIQRTVQGNLGAVLERMVRSKAEGADEAKP